MRLFIYFLIGGLINTAKSLEGESIIGGVETESSGLGYQVSLQAFGGHSCGGSIIGEQFVLTAAHCVTVRETNEFVQYPLKIVAGVNNIYERTETAVELDVVEAYIPVIYDSSQNVPIGDIAVLKLSEKLNLGSFSTLSKLSLPLHTKRNQDSYNAYENMTATISGFGWDEVRIEIKLIDNQIKLVENGTTSGKLFKAKALIISSSDCNLFYWKQISENLQICAKIIENPPNVYQGICSGDSGGPLVQDNTVIGVVSFSRVGCNDMLSPGVYTRIATFRRFIRNVMKGVITEKMRVNTW